jgi:Leucine-rich repeat (LRR) protein
MKKLLLILLCFPLISLAQQTYVPDDFFEFTLVNLGYDSILDDSVLTANINTITNLSITNQNISDLTGIEDFVDLEALLLMGNNLTVLDISNNLLLNTLGCSLNQLTSIDVSDNILLTNLYLAGNQLGSIDISNNVNLVELNLANNLLLNIDISNNLLLNGFGIGTNQLTSLDVSNHTLLSSLSCDDNQLTNLDVSQNTALTSLYCSGNQVTSIDVSGATALTSLYCYNNQLTSLDVRNGNNTNIQNFDSQNNPNLFCIDVDNIALSNVLWGANIDSWSSFSTNCVTALGCTDSLACNYNSIAVINNASCYYYVESFDTVTTNNSYTWLAYNLTVSGDYSDTLTNSVGCDSIVNLNLTITNTTGLLDIIDDKKNLIKITDILGQETPYRKNTPLFYIYDDGTVEKRITID